MTIPARNSAGLIMRRTDGKWATSCTATPAPCTNCTPAAVGSSVPFAIDDLTTSIDWAACAPGWTFPYLTGYPQASKSIALGLTGNLTNTWGDAGLWVYQNTATDQTEADSRNNHDEAFGLRVRCGETFATSTLYTVAIYAQLIGNPFLRSQQLWINNVATGNDAYAGFNGQQLQCVDVV